MSGEASVASAAQFTPNVPNQLAVNQKSPPPSPDAYGQFYFAEYLHMFDPTQEYVLDHLGTSTNVTARATKKNPPTVDNRGKGKAANQDQTQVATLPTGGIFPEHQSFIMIFSPPYVAAFGTSAPMSTYRQQVEAKALALFGPGSQFEKLAEISSITIPKLLRLDIHSNVLLISDIGELLTLADSLRVLQTLKGERDEQELQSSFTLIGKRIGEFFGNLHAPSTIAQIEDHHLKEFQNDGIKELFFSIKIQPMKKYLKLVEVPYHVKAYNIIERDFWDGDRLPGARVFALGDLGTDTILILEDTLTTGIIGWQFSGPGRGLNGDIAEIVAKIRTLMFEVEDIRNPQYFSADALLTGITTSYRRTSRKNLTDWSVGWDGYIGDWGSLHLPRTTVSILRSAFIVFGTKTIETAMTLKGICDCKERPNRDGCQRRMCLVVEGCWHVRMAGDDDDEFMGNWREICERGSALLPLVLGD